MKVLWLSSSNTLFNEKGDRAYNGKGWIASLQDAVAEYGKDITLGVAFLSSENSDAIVRDGITYFRIRKRQFSGFRKLYRNWTGGNTENYDDRKGEIVKEFSPDIVHIFGCESKLASAVASITGRPVIIHIQGILNETVPYFYPPGFSGSDMIVPQTFVNEVILRNGFIHLYEDFRTRAENEKKYLSVTRSAMGRTEWDRNICEKYSRAEYFRVNETLRKPFYRNAGQWKYRPGKHRTVLLSTISEVPYKGLDLVLRTADILRQRGTDFEWRVAGIRNDSGIVKIFEKKTGIKAEDCGIVFMGIVSEDDIVREMLSSDIYVHPSYIENSSNSVCEAQMLGMPVIAAGTGGIPSLVSHGYDGILIPPGKAEALADWIDSTSCSGTRMEQLGKAAAETASRRHDRRKIVEDLTGAYRKSIESFIDNNNFNN